MPSAYDQFMLFGDSITQEAGNQERGFGFSTQLQHDYLRKLDVVNRGFSGYNTRKAVRVLPRFFPSQEEANVRILMVFFGANDASVPECGNGQHVPLEEFRANITKLCTDALVQAHRPRIILVTPGPIDEYQMEVTDRERGRPTTRTADHTKLYADATRQVGQELGVATLDLWTRFIKEAGWIEGQPLPGRKDQERNAVLSELLHDGLHFHPKGYQIMYDETRALIAREFPDQDPKNLDLVFPPWDDELAWEKSGF